MFLIRIALAIATLMIAPGSHAQSLADAARKAEEARAKQDQARPDDKKSDSVPVRRVFTNADLKEVPPAPATSPAATKTEVPAKDTPNKTPETPGGPVRDEAWWRTRMTGLRANVDQATAACVPRAAEVARLETVLESVPPAYTTSNHELAKARARADLDTCVGLIGLARAAFGAAEDEGRCSGVAPGWLR
jgi:outer membrane murein-binding lipoprotein Lpp